MSKQLEPGTYVDSHWGHYQSARIVELARELGWAPEPHDGRNHITEAEFVDSMATTYMELGNVGNMDDWYDIVSEAEDWINDNLVPEDHWFGHHPDIGDVGVWEIEDE